MCMKDHLKLRVLSISTKFPEGNNSGGSWNTLDFPVWGKGRHGKLRGCPCTPHPTKKSVNKFLKRENSEETKEINLNFYNILYEHFLLSTLLPKYTTFQCTPQFSGNLKSFMR